LACQDERQVFHENLFTRASYSLHVGIIGWLSTTSKPKGDSMNMIRVGRHPVWSIILAGGNGERLGPLIHRWLGHHKPKQYCAFIGTRSMLQHTLDRADRLTAPAHRVLICARTHQREAFLQQTGRPPGTVILQPANRGTVAGIFIPLMYVRARDPEAIVVIYPSDHFIYPEDRFLETVQRAIWTAEWLADRVVLLGASPSSPEPEYGWIRPGSSLAGTVGRSVRAVEAFHEKPALAEASAAWAGGALWNTMIMVAKAETVWRLGWRCFPELMPMFERIAAVIGSPQQKVVMDAVYQAMPPMDFSSDVLQKAPDQLAVIEMNGVIWSDWGKAERIVETLRQIGRQPAFPLEFAAADPDVGETGRELSGTRHVHYS
jgi:mannose-1-phosphate guanylyltransferase